MTYRFVSTARRVHPRPILLGLAILALIQPLPARAAPINISHEIRDLKQFLAGGIERWINSKPPKFPTTLNLRQPNGVLKNNDLVGYLEWRRAQDPAVFDARHPRIAKVLQQGQPLSKATFLGSTTPPPVTTPTAGTLLIAIPATAIGTVSVAGKGAALHVASSPAAEMLSVPEPSGLTLALGILGSAAWWHRRRAQGMGDPLRRGGSGA